MRIALHPSAVAALSGIAMKHDRRLMLPPDEATPHASHEWNYLPSEAAANKTPRKQRDELLSHVQGMKVASPSRPDVRIHYDRAEGAISCMTAQMHDEWLKPGR